MFGFTNNIFSDNPKLRRVSLELAVCRKIIKAMGGDINIISKKEEGTEVIMQIPFEKTSIELINEISKQQKTIHENFKLFSKKLQRYKPKQTK